MSIVTDGKVLVLGGTGMAGHVVALYLRHNGFLVDTQSVRRSLDSETHHVDVRDEERLELLLKSRDYEIVVNCVGLLVKPSELHKDLAVYLNSYLPHLLETMFEASTTRIIHLSTDCVFSGARPPYPEDAPVDGPSFYDRSKALGEVINQKDLTFRMYLVGPEITLQGTGLFNWFWTQKGEVAGYTHAMWNGITTLELAKGIKTAIEEGVTGLYHLVPEMGISKFTLLRTFKDVFRRDDLVIIPDGEINVDKTLVNTRSDFRFQIPDYRTMFEEMRDWMTAQGDFYSHYRGFVQ